LEQGGAFSPGQSGITTTNAMMKLIFLQTIAILSSFQIKCVEALNIVLAGGTGSLAKTLIPKLHEHDVTVLCRNAFLAAAPARVSSDYGWVGQSFLDKNEHVKLRDWDGGDLLDIVGQDFLGWQEDALQKADVVVNLVGGFTEQRVMATERIIRESLRLNPSALQVCISPLEEELKRKVLIDRVKKCEDMYSGNCFNVSCLRLEYNREEDACASILDAIGNHA